MTDLDIIKQLEQEIGRKLRQISLDKVTSWNKENGYAVDENNNVVGLNLDYSGLFTIPNALINLKNLQRLSIVSNKIAELPTTFAQLQNLSELILENNQLKELSAWFGQLQNLSYLDLSGNQLKFSSEIWRYANQR
jgi:Leucine-rich repeat (LRR) protein